MCYSEGSTTDSIQENGFLLALELKTPFLIESDDESKVEDENFQAPSINPHTILYLIQRRIEASSCFFLCPYRYRTFSNFLAADLRHVKTVIDLYAHVWAQVKNSIPGIEWPLLDSILESKENTVLDARIDKIQAQTQEHTENTENTEITEITESRENTESSEHSRETDSERNPKRQKRLVVTDRKSQPFVLKIVDHDGYACGICPWVKACQGCSLYLQHENESVLMQPCRMKSNYDQIEGKDEDNDKSREGRGREGNAASLLALGITNGQIIALDWDESVLRGFYDSEIANEVEEHASIQEAEIKRVNTISLISHCFCSRNCNTNYKMIKRLSV